MKSRKRQKFFKRAAEIEEDFSEARKQILRQMRAAQSRLDAKNADLKSAILKQAKAKGGWLWKQKTSWQKLFKF